jgi:hypothetical protein
MSIQKLKSLGMPQNPFMFKIDLGIPRDVGKIFSLPYLVRSTKIPYTFERECRVIRVAGNQEFVIPTQFILAGHDWELIFLFLEENDESFNALNQWCYATDNIQMEFSKALATIQLLNLNEEVTHTFYMEGIFPKRIEFNEDLSYDEVSGFYTYTMLFSFDNIYKEKEGIIIRNLT